MTLYRGSAIRLRSGGNLWNQCKDQKRLQKAQGRGLVFVNETYTLPSTSGKDYDKQGIEAMKSENEHEYRWEN